MKHQLIVPALILTAALAFAIGIINSHKETQSLKNEIVEDVLPPEEAEQSRAEQVAKALAAAYPLSIEKAEFRDGDRAVLLRDTWYYYAEGRMLPEELMDRVSEYGPVLFSYNYQKELPPWTEPAAEQIDRFRNRNRNNNTEGTRRPRLQRSLAFQENLWQAGNRNESSKQVKPVKFLGNTVTVHSDIEEVLSQVEERIKTAAKIEPEVQDWITNIGEMHGWSWRNVAGSASRSNHSYGIAIDILPKSLGGKATYWQWTENWWNIPYEDRYHPPDTVIKAFEAYGFIWGGKWTFFDTMHFEYHPEIFILSGLELAETKHELQRNEP